MTMRVQFLVVAATLSGCAANVPVQLVFPSTGAFDASELVRIDVVPLAPDALGTCPELLAASLVGAPDGVVYTLEPTDVCAVQAGIAIPDPGAGAFVFSAQALDGANTPVLAGCTVAETYPGGPAVRIELFPTASYTPGTRAGASCSPGAP